MSLFTDSKVCLHWLTSVKPQPTFVRNRILELKQYTNITFSYVSTHENSCDLSSRGVKLDDLKNNEEVRNLWFHGPPWLSKGQENWPKCEIPPLDNETIQMLESKKDKSSEKEPIVDDHLPD